MLPRIEQRDLAALEVGSVSRYDREIVDPGARSDKTIDGVPWSPRVEPPPLLSDASIDRDYAVRESFVQLAKPVSEDLRLSGVSGPQLFDAFTDLTQRHHTEMELGVVNVSDPRSDVQIATSTDL
jgi:hypothetical protein